MRDQFGLAMPTTLLRMGTWRYPFFLVDRIDEFKRGPRGHIRTHKNVSFNEPFFGGHFPDNPVMPGVLIAEVMGQTSEYLTALNEFCDLYDQRHPGQPVKDAQDLMWLLNGKEGLKLIDELRDASSGYLAAQNIKFKSPVFPGDVLEVTSELKLADGHGFFHYQVEARVGRRTACSGRIVNFRAPKTDVMQELAAMRNGNDTSTPNQSPNQ